MLFRRMTCAGLLAALSLPLLAHASMSVDRYADVARWMIQQEAPETRAAGMLLLAGGPADEISVDPEIFLETMRELMNESPSGPELFMLSQGCAGLDIEGACIEAGLPEAIATHDGGNPLSAGALYAADSSAFRELLISADSVDDYVIEFAIAWYEALKANDHEAWRDTELISAMSLAMAVAMPALSPITRLCRDAVDSDEALDQACQRLADKLQESDNTLMLQSVGFGMARSRAEALEDDALAAEYESRRRAVMEEVACLGKAAYRPLADDPDV